MNKYYKPDISEFYVGFEYFVDGDYRPRMFRCEFPQDVRKMPIVLGNVKVKYLDREDIESLGFEDLGSLWFFKESCLTVNDRGGLNCKIRKWKNQELDIYADYNDGDELQLIFRGVIKNKSELKKVLKMIGVGYENNTN